MEKPTDFVSCDDWWFRPVDPQLDPDGDLDVADFYNCIIGRNVVEELPVTGLRLPVVARAGEEARVVEQRQHALERAGHVGKRLRGFLADRPNAVAAVTKIFLDEIERFLLTASGVTPDADTPSAVRPPTCSPGRAAGFRWTQA